jgi:signal transduction histidine kinase/DNA-binding response OmpR family regulator
MENEPSSAPATPLVQPVIAAGIRAQKVRFTAYTMAGAIGLISVRLGLVPATYLDFILGLGAAYLTCALFYLLYRWPALSEHTHRLAPAWMACDAVLITLSIQLSGGIASPWFPWYLANIAAAAFVFGEAGAALVALVDTAAYIGLLYWRGELEGLDPELSRPLLQMIFLYASSFYFLRGVTSLRKRQRLIRRLRADERRQLEEFKRVTKELDRRTRELQLVNLELSEATRLKSQFLANMSHELRTPLNSIIGFSEILSRKLADGLSPRHKKFINNIHTSGQQLLVMINDILDLAKIEVGDMELQPVQLTVDAVVDGVIRVVRGGVKERRIEIETDLPETPLTLVADPSRVKQILYNLVSNAIKFSPDGSTVTVSARWLGANESPLGQDSVELAVIDHGIGIAYQDQYVIFEEFRQVDGSSTRRYDGVGLGLALVKRFTNLHRGIVTVHSEPGQGSVFTVVLPQHFSGDTTGSQAITLPDVLYESSRTILVVEDDPSAFESICGYLEATEYIPVRAHNGQEAIDLARAIRPLAIILDIVLPGIDGWEVLKLLKAESGTSTVPIIIVSMLENRELGLALGADDYFTKPVDGERLCARLSELLAPPVTSDAQVLLIDDDPTVHELIEAELIPHGYQVLQAHDGAEGIKAAFAEQPDIIVLDLMMEGMDGFEVAAALKANPEVAHLPIVVLTAKELTRDDRQRLHGKIQALLQKAPTSPAALVQVIETLLSRRSPRTRPEDQVDTSRTGSETQNNAENKLRGGSP